MIPDHAPFTPEQRRAIASLVAALAPEQRFWLGGFLSAGAAGAAAAPARPAKGPKLTILYGTESGNAEKLADLTSKEAAKRGLKATITNMADVEPSFLEKVENLLVIVSTWGEGDAPESAEKFHKAFLASDLKLSDKLRYSVCALGDTAYEKFCQVGKEVDARLEALGATRVVDRQDCDVAYKEPHAKWMQAVLDVFAAGVAAEPEPVGFDFSLNGFVGANTAVEYDRDKPFAAELTEKGLLNDNRGSIKETWHYEISLEGSGITYEPGDALAVVPVNAPDVVDAVLAAAKLNGAAPVEKFGCLREALAEEYDITTLSKNLLEKLSALTGSDKLKTLLAEESKEALKNYIYGRELVDALTDFAPDGLTAEQLLGMLRQLPQRLYSIASSQAAVEDAVHLTVASVRYESHGRKRKGVTSTYLADLANVGDQVKVFVQKNKHFRLPESHDTPIIMVGPGTGVAPFRAFVQHRAAAGAKGKSWLFFGDQRYSYDFLYQLEWQEHLANGALTKLDVAFSRDQPEKVYVQHKMLQRGAEIYAWLQEGAHFYICGDANRMAHDVQEALLQILKEHGNQSREAAEAELETLRKAHRYQKDVY